MAAVLIIEIKVITSFDAAPKPCFRADCKMNCTRTSSTGAATRARSRRSFQSKFDVERAPQFVHLYVSPLTFDTASADVIVDLHAGQRMSPIQLGSYFACTLLRKTSEKNMSCRPHHRCSRQSRRRAVPKQGSRCHHLGSCQRRQR